MRKGIFSLMGWAAPTASRLCVGNKEPVLRK
jgi:hypothetical protein